MEQEEMEAATTVQMGTISVGVVTVATGMAKEERKTPVVLGVATFLAEAQEAQEPWGLEETPPLEATRSPLAVGADIMAAVAVLITEEEAEEVPPTLVE